MRVDEAMITQGHYVLPIAVRGLMRSLDSQGCTLEHGGDRIRELPNYLGLRFTIAGETHYGWARLSIPSAAGFTLKDYAYNSVPGEGILAGQTQCSTPFALAVNDVDSNSVDLTWVSFGADTFNLRYRPTGTVIWSEIDTITTTNLTVAGLADCTEYEYQVAAACNGRTATGLSAASSSPPWAVGRIDISYCPSCRIAPDDE